MKNKNTKESETYKKIGVGAAIVVVVVVIILLLLRSCGGPDDGPGPASSLTPSAYLSAAGMKPTSTPFVIRSTRRSRRA